MSNRDRAADVIRAHGFDPCRVPECIAQDLADAGLLAPDLPEPSKAGFWHTDNTVTRALTNRLVEAGFYSQGVDTYVKLAPAEARELAANLTAAANAAEEVNRD